MPPSRVPRRLRSSLQQLVPILGSAVVWLLGVAYASMKRFRADWHAVNGEVPAGDVFEETVLLAADMPDMDNLAFLLEKDEK